MAGLWALCLKCMVSLAIRIYLPSLGGNQRQLHSLSCFGSLLDDSDQQLKGASHDRCWCFHWMVLALGGSLVSPDLLSSLRSGSNFCLYFIDKDAPRIFRIQINFPLRSFGFFFSNPLKVSRLS